MQKIANFLPLFAIVAISVLFAIFSGTQKFTLFIIILAVLYNVIISIIGFKKKIPIGDLGALYILSVICFGISLGLHFLNLNPALIGILGIGISLLLTWSAYKILFEHHETSYIKKMAEEADVDGLITILLDEDASNLHRREAANCLKYIGDVRAVEPLITVLNDALKYDLDLKKDLTRALGKIGDDRAVDILINVLAEARKAVSNQGVFEEPFDSYLVEELVENLGNIGDPKAVEPLRALIFQLSYAKNKKIAGTFYDTEITDQKMVDIMETAEKALAKIDTTP